MARSESQGVLDEADMRESELRMFRTPALALSTPVNELAAGAKW